ncbi:MAG: cation transporter [Deltaproteobacteria bacterium]|nr:cation transporter [Deltaproteobacteria bacterium]
MSKIHEEFQIRRKQIQKVLWITLFLNFLVAGLKLGYGHLTHTLSMIADGYHSLLDGSSNIIGLIAIALATKPADRNHPYGHRNAEAIASMFISGMLFLACYEIASSAYHRFFNHESPHVNFGSFLIMIFTMLINYGVSRYEHKQGHELGSQILTSDSAHTRSDVFASLAVIIALIGTYFKLYWLDILAASGIAIFVGYSGYQIIRESLNTLMDRIQIDPDQIKELAMAIPGVKDAHHVRSRGHSASIFMDLNIHVKPNLSLEEAHEITHQVIEKIKAEIPEVVDVVVHTEPATQNHL